MELAVEAGVAGRGGSEASRREMGEGEAGGRGMETEWGGGGGRDRGGRVGGMRTE